jgi:type I restriction-modification system DNA methylase subunit
MTDQQLIKETGATFTPSALADYISDKIVSYTDYNGRLLEIIDPSCGDGSLLTSISRKFSELNWKHSLTGYDLNQDYLETANSNLKEILPSEHFNLIQSDFLTQIEVENKTLSLFEDSNNQNTLNNRFDLVIANPPYVRTQILGSNYSQEIAKKFNLKGRVDLYHPFLIAMTLALKENGILGVITSNRYLSTKGGASIREFLFKNFELLEIIDLGDTKLFDAAVLPAILIGRKKTNPSKEKNNPKFIRIYEDHNNFTGEKFFSENIFSAINHNADGYFTVNGKVFKKASGKILINSKKGDTWSLLTTKEEEWVKQIQNASEFRVGNLFKVRVGIKTTADKVFIKDDWEQNDNTPESEILRNLISQENIRAWGASLDSNLKVLYPHYCEDNKRKVVDITKYPNAETYLNQHKEKLSSRKYLIDAGRNWFELWVPQNPKFWDMPKLVFPDISLNPRFCFDESGKIVNGNCYWIVAKTESEVDILFLIQGISNSLLMTKYHDLLFNNKLYSGRRRYFTQFVEKYPLPNLASSASREIIKIVKQLNNLNGEGDISLLTTKLEHAVAKAFNVPPVLSLA